MKDNDFIIPLRCFLYEEENCKSCVYLKRTEKMCHELFYADILDLINRQKAEIERLEQNLKEAFEEIEALKQVNLTYKAEAVKEFAERLKNYYIKNKIYDKPNAHTLIGFLFCQIDNLVEEMVGDTDV